MTRFGLVNWLCKVGTFGETTSLSRITSSSSIPCRSCPTASAWETDAVGSLRPPAAGDRLGQLSDNRLRLTSLVGEKAATRLASPRATWLLSVTESLALPP